MEVISLHTDVDVSETECLWVVYKLIFQNSLYGIECFIEGTDKSSPRNYCLVNDISSDERFAVKFLKKISSGKVMPLHLFEITQDIFPCGTATLHS